MARAKKKAEPKLREKLPEIIEGQSALPSLTIAQRDQSIRALVSSLNDGDDRFVVLADQAPNTYALRRPTGLPELDITLGGGWPAGGFSFIAGPENAGKSWLLLKTMAMQQKIYGSECRLAFAISERQFPYDVAMRVGLKIPVPDYMIEQWQEMLRLRGLPPYTSEQLAYFKQSVGDVYIFRGATGEQVLQSVLEAVRTNAFSVIGLDSEQGLQPIVDSDKVMDENETRAAHANMMGKFYKKYIPMTTGFGRVVPNQTTLLLTKQVRSNQDRANASPAVQKYIPTWAPAGSWTGKHYALINLVVSDGKKLSKGEGEDREAYGKVFKWKTDKGSAGIHDNQVGEANYYYAFGGTDDIGDLITTGQRLGVVRVDKKVMVAQAGTNAILEAFTCNTQKAFRELISSSVDHEMALRREVLAAAGFQCLFR
jgi:RecA/RadA recombinase